ncbi:hypothetical protein ACOI1C_12015 [Bacillus sp. DJP31]|uniref:hypothetical protein n=1 Tax=Bacillus sp. DJP31 TaxID=3409789 RepID=UPI003BB793B3
MFTVDAVHKNISIIENDGKGEYWSIGSISKTATHDLEKGYDVMYIDFLPGNQTGYLVVIRNGVVLAFRSVNTGVTWDIVEERDSLYPEMMTHFGL